MSQQKDKDDSKKAQAATNLAFPADDNLSQQEPQIQEQADEQQKDTIQVPEHDPLDDSGVFSPNPPSGAAAPIFPKPTDGKEKSPEKQSPSTKRLSRRSPSPSIDRLKAGAGALYKNVKEVVKTVLRSSSSSPKKESLTDEAKADHLRPPVKEEVTKKKRNLSMVSMASQQTDTDPELDSGLTEVSTLPESDTFDRSVAPLPSEDSVDNLAERVGKMEIDVPEADKSGDTDIETDLPEADKYKASDDKKDDGKKDDVGMSGDNKE